VADNRIILPGGSSRGLALEALAHRVIILVGSFGSGKSEIAVNLAFGLRNRGDDVSLVDLDTVKPYFRCRLARDDLAARGIRLVAPTGDRFYADLPILVPEARAAGQNGAGRKDRVILDVGGDDLGARVLGSISGSLDLKATDLLFVVNVNRPFAENPASLRGMLNRVQSAARLGVSGLVANTHLMDETTRETVLDGIRTARALEAASGIPLRFCVMLEELAGTFGGPEGHADSLPILAIERHIVAPFAPMPRGAMRRSAVV